MKLSKTTLAALALFITVLLLLQSSGSFYVRDLFTIFITLFSSIISSFLIFKVLLRVTGFMKYGIIGVISHISWISLFSDFSTKAHLTLIIFLFVIFILLESNEKKMYIYSFISGLFVFLLMILDQSFWVIYLPLLTFHLLRKGNKKLINLLYSFYGLLWGIIFFVTYLLLTKTFNKFIFKISNNTYWESSRANKEIFSDFNFYGLLDFTYFISLVSLVLLISSLASILILIYRKRFHLIFIPLTIVFLWVDIFLKPNSYSDNLILLSLYSIPLSLIMNQLPTVFIKICCYFVIIFITIIGFYFALSY